MRGTGAAVVVLSTVVDALALFVEAFDAAVRSGRSAVAILGDRFVVAPIRTNTAVDLEVAARGFTWVVRPHAEGLVVASAGR